MNLKSYDNNSHDMTLVDVNEKLGITIRENVQLLLSGNQGVYPLNPKLNVKCISELSSLFFLFYTDRQLSIWSKYSHQASGTVNKPYTGDYHI